jgi:ATP-dependent RNA helicase DeaD
MEQNAREKTMRAFKAKEVTILVCTDVASRGIDVKDLTHVINYSLPRELDLYIHRIGRTGRGGKEGIAWSLVTPSHQWLVGRIEREAGAKIKLGTLPTQDAVMKLKVGRLLSSFAPKDAAPSKAVTAIQESLLDTGWSEAIAMMSKEEIVARFLAQNIKMEFKHPDSKGGKGSFAKKYGLKSSQPEFSRSKFSRPGSARPWQKHSERHSEKRHSPRNTGASSSA